MRLKEKSSLITVMVILTPRNGAIKGSKKRGKSKAFTVYDTNVPDLYDLFTKTIKKLNEK